MNIIELEDHIRDVIQDEIKSYVGENVNNDMTSLSGLRSTIKNLMEDLQKDDLINGFNITDYDRNKIEVQFNLPSETIDSIPIKLTVDTSGYSEKLCIFKQLDKMLINRE